MIKKIFIFLCLILLLVGCSHRPPDRVETFRPERPIIIKGKQNKVVVSPGVHQFNPNLGKMVNDTSNIFISIWVDPRPNKGGLTGHMYFRGLEKIFGQPDFVLSPGVGKEIEIDHGIHKVYAEGFVLTSSGLESIGLNGPRTRELIVDSQMLKGGHYGFLRRFRRGDFKFGK